jgi:hypothetical protein
MYHEHGRIKTGSKSLKKKHLTQFKGWRSKHAATSPPKKHYKFDHPQG